jgi:DNA gyrase subunit A
MRFPVSTVRVFASRASTGVRGIALADGDEVISMSLVDGGKGITTEERDAYLRQSRALRQAENAGRGERGTGATPTRRRRRDTLSPERFEELQAKEEFVLTVASTGFGKRTSAYEYRVTGRGGKGVELMRLPEGGQVVAAFPVCESDQIMLVTDGGTLIRCPVDGIRIAGRGDARRAHRQCQRGRARRSRRSASARTTQRQRQTDGVRHSLKRTVD